MLFFGFEILDIESLDTTDPAVQKQLLKNKTPYQCKTCKEIAWVVVGAEYKEDDYTGYGIHMHVTTSYFSQGEMTDVEDVLDLGGWPETDE